MNNFILDLHGEPVPEPDILVWAEWYETANRRVAEDVIGQYRVSTVFLGINHNFQSDGLPVLWETMVFCDDKRFNDYQRRYTSREDAITGHAETHEMLRRSAEEN